MPGTEPALNTDAASRDFERFRATGAPEALTAVFDRVGGKLLALASHVAPDPASAEDLVQECFLVAIRKARRWDSSRPVLPWLVGILLRDAKRQRRRAARHLDVERLAPADAPDGAIVAMDADTLAAVELAVAELPAAYRVIVRAATIDGEKPRDIARRLDRAPGTVRVQLHRGLDLLRRALPVGLGVGAAIGAAPRGMAQVRAALESEARLRGPALAAGGLALPAVSLPSLHFSGALLMTAKIVSLLAAAALFAGGYYMVTRDVPKSETVGAVSSTDDDVESELEGLNPLDVVAASDASRVNALAPTVSASRPTEGGDASPTAATTTCEVTGRIVPPEGMTLDAPWVGFLEDGKHGIDDSSPLPTGAFEGGGSFTIVLDVGATGVLLFADQLGRVGRRAWTVPEDAVFNVGELVLAPGASISGTAWMHGKPLKVGQFVLAQAEYDATPRALMFQRLQMSGESIVRGSAAAVIEEGGVFSLSGLEPGVEYRLVAAPPRREDPRAPSLLIAAMAGLPVVAPESGVRLESGVVAVKLVVQSGGQPVTTASLAQLLAPDDPRRKLSIGFLDGLLGPMGQSGQSTEAGEISVQLIEGAPVHAEVSALGFETVPLILDPSALQSGEEIPVELVRDAQTVTIAVRVAGVDPARLAGFKGVLFGSDRTFKRQRLGPVPIEEGLARFEDVTAELMSARFFLTPPDLAGLADLPYVRVAGGSLNVAMLAPGETRTVEVQATVGGRVELNLTGRVATKPPQFEIIEASGNVVRPPLYVRDAGGHRQIVVATSDGPIYMGMSLPAGTYTLRQSGPHYAAGELEVKLVPGQATPVAFHLEPR